MTTERQRAANRRNAARSTGPRSAEGQSRASRNARRHGLTARPELSEVEKWVRIITEGVDDAILPCPGDPDWQVVLRLAEAEAHLDRVRHYQTDLLVEDQAGPIMPDLTLGDMARRARERLLVHRETGQLSRQEVRDAKQTVDMFRKHYRETTRTAHALRSRVLRYRAQAEARRARALKAWIDLQETKRTQLQS